MSPPPWTTPKQQEYLHSRRDDHKKAQDPKNMELTLPDFRNSVQRDFFHMWPTQEVEQQEWAEAVATDKKRKPPALMANNEDWMADRRKV
jgi:hypothetical protein